MKENFFGELVGGVPWEPVLKEKELRKAGRSLRTASSKHNSTHPKTQENATYQENILVKQG